MTAIGDIFAGRIGVDDPSPASSMPWNKHSRFRQIFGSARGRSDAPRRFDPRQRQIMELMLAGHPSKNIAADLGLSQRTVENHRAAVMKKTGSHSLSALIRLALAADPGTGSQCLR